MKINKLFIILYLVFVIFLGGYFRYKNFASIPFPGQSVDEYSNSWVGLSLIRLGVPVGISGLGGYKNNDYRYINVDRIFQNGNAVDGSPMPMNKPWFDHPPLLGLITGGWAYIKGARVFDDTTASIIRKPMIACGTLTIFALFMFSKVFFNTKVAVLATLIYAFSPLVIVSSRMVQSENAFIPIGLLSLASFGLFRKKRQVLYLLISFVLAGLALLFKLSAIFIALTLFLILLRDYKLKNLSTNDFYKALFMLILIVTFFLGAFVIYGLVFDIDIFIDVFKSNSNRFYGIGPQAIYDLFVSQKITLNKNMTDMYIFWGWIAFLMLWTLPIKNKFFVLIPITSYLCVYLYFGSQPYGWYTFPFFAYLSICLSLIINFLYKNKNSVLLAVMYVTMLGFYVFRFTGLTDFQQYSKQWRVFVPLILVSSLFFKNKKLYKYLFALAILSLFILNFLYFMKIDVDYWYKVF